MQLYNFTPRVRLKNLVVVESKQKEREKKKGARNERAGGRKRAAGVQIKPGAANKTIILYYKVSQL